MTLTVCPGIADQKESISEIAMVVSERRGTIMSGKEIIILGSQNYQNEILAYYLEHEKGIECRILPPDCGLATGHSGANRGSRLFLIDCSKADVARYFMHPPLDGDRPAFQHPVSIFNTRRDSGTVLPSNPS